MNEYFVIVPYDNRNITERVRANDYKFDSRVLVFLDSNGRKVCAYKDWIKVTQIS